MFDYCNFGLFEVNSAKIKKQPPRHKEKAATEEHREKIKGKKQKGGFPLSRERQRKSGMAKRSGNNKKKNLDYKKKQDGR